MSELTADQFRRLAKVYFEAHDAQAAKQCGGKATPFEEACQSFQEGEILGAQALVAELEKTYVVMPKAEHEALKEAIEAAEDVIRDVPDAIDPRQPDEDDIDRARDLEAQIRYAGAALDALKDALKKVRS